MSVSAPPSSSRRPRIVVVDDSDSSRDLTRVILEEHGFEVVLLASPLGISGFLAREKPDLVLMDVEMPALEGDKAVAITRRHGLHRCPIVLYSGRQKSELEALARHCGANGFVSKTAGPEVLVAAVRQFLAST